MKKAVKLIGIIALAALIGFSFTACGGDDETTGTSTGGGGTTGGGNVTGNTPSGALPAAVGKMTFTNITAGVWANPAVEHFILVEGTITETPAIGPSIQKYMLGITKISSETYGNTLTNIYLQKVATQDAPVAIPLYVSEIQPSGALKLDAYAGNGKISATDQLNVWFITGSGLLNIVPSAGALPTILLGENELEAGTTVIQKILPATSVPAAVATPGFSSGNLTISWANLQDAP